MQRYFSRLLIGMAMLSMSTGVAGAGETGHYVNGVEGIKGSSVPGPGFYYRIYNVLYNADTLTDDKGSDVTWDKGVHDRVYAIGPEISRFFPSLMIGFSLKHLWEFDAKDRSEGYATAFNITKVFKSGYFIKSFPDYKRWYGIIIVEPK